MTQPIFTSDLFQQIQNETANVMALMFISTVKLMLLSYWSYIAIFLVVLFVGMMLQIIMFRGGRRSKLPSWFNRLAGSVFYWIFFGLELTISYLIWGSGVFDEIWFAVFGLISFPVTKCFLLKIGFWYY